MNWYRIIIIATLIVGLSLQIEAIPMRAVDPGWTSCLGSYDKLESDSGSRGLLMLKPLDSGCVLFDLSVAIPKFENNIESNIAFNNSSTIFADESNNDRGDKKDGAVAKPFSKVGTYVSDEVLANSPTYRASGIFIIDEMGKGYWEDYEDSGVALVFTKFNKRITIKSIKGIPSAVEGSYEFCAPKINCTVPMIRSLIDYLPQFRTTISKRLDYKVDDISDASEYRKVRYISSEGDVVVFWATLDLSQLFRVIGDNGIVVYQTSEKQ